jgi:hypothetical protein
MDRTDLLMIWAAMKAAARITTTWIAWLRISAKLKFPHGRANVAKSSMQ